MRYYCSAYFIFCFTTKIILLIVLLFVLVHDSEWVKMEPRGVLAGYLGLSKSKLTLLITTTGDYDISVCCILSKKENGARSLLLLQ